ncbi:dethiobiotin synthase [Williamsia sp. CHRR-6]|uniref:dethiobiotin synthase n=1 Tax=Williamsia sp. CHRR-6 TaxID=2835871 RepID=UPI001BDA60E0|nr:dethiobiotin synthase [Williamsia sp. CHRR-6]MBT0565225.1 dethiobiotin synthase [Williamsia sp. CHRR-6]
MSVIVVTGTSTDVGKTVATAALAATLTGGDGRDASVAVCKPVQTGVGVDEPGDLAEIVRLAGVRDTREVLRYPDPLAPETAATRAGMAPATLGPIVAAVRELHDHDHVLVEGAGGVLVRLGPDLTLLDVADALQAPVLVVVGAGLGTLNHTELTVGAVTDRGLRVAGLVIGSWPAQPGLAEECNRTDLPRLTGVDVVGVVPEGAGAWDRDAFCAAAPTWFVPDWVQSVRSV